MDTSHWTHRYWDIECLYPLLAETRFLQGILIGKMSSLDPALQQEATKELLTQDIISTAELEGEIFNADEVKSAIEGWMSQTMEPSRVQTRLNSIVSVHLDLNDSTQHIYSWAKQEDSIDPFIKAAVAHLWVLTDVETNHAHLISTEKSSVVTNGITANGILARAVTDILLTQAEYVRQSHPLKFYSLSTQILKEKPYYESVLERTLRNPHDISEWIEWFLYCLKSAVQASETHLAAILFKHEFWSRYAIQIDNDRQRQILEMLLNGYSEKLTTTVWAEITNCSQDTALRDIQDLIDKEILEKLPGGGRSTAYALKDSPDRSAS